MKKYLMTGVAAIAISGALTSCSHDEIEMITQSQINHAKYQQAFVQSFGQPSPTQTWGFGASKARTRAAEEFGWEISEGYDAEFDKAYYDAVLELLPEKVKAEGKLTNYEFLSTGPFSFSIIYSNTSANDKVGYYYYDPAQGVASRQEVQFVDDIQTMSNYIQWSYAQIWDGVAYWTVDGAGITGQNVKDVWGWQNERGAQTSKMNAKVITVNIPAGYRVGFYVINDVYKMYSNQALNSDGLYYSAIATKDDVYLVGLEDWNSVSPDADFDCNDVIMSVNKGSNPPTIVENPKDPTPSTEEPKNYEGRVFAEDLSASDESDFDFNDVVFDWELTTTGANIRLLAAGGTLPLYIGGTLSADGKSIIGGVEVHNQFGETSTSVMINTGVNNGYDYQEFPITGSYASANDIPVWVLKDGTYELLEAKRGEAACKINVPVGTKWVDEFVSISRAYTNFSSWVQNEANSVDWANPVARFVDLNLSNND